MSTVLELGKELEQKREAAAARLVEWQKGATPELTAELLKRNDELTELSKAYDDAVAVEKFASSNSEELRKWKAPSTQPVHPGGSTQQPAQSEPGTIGGKSLRQFLVEHEGYTAFREGRTKTAAFDIDYKTLMTLTTINNVATRLPGIQGMPLEERTVRDLMLQGTTDNNTITYMEETTLTNAAAETAEGVAKPESALAFTERTENVRKIPTWIPATAELLADVSGIQSYIEGRLVFMVKRREEQQLLTGDGTAPNISGILDRANIQTQAKGADSVPVALFKAMTKIRNTGFSEPTAIVMHPNDWQDLVLLQDTTGQFLFGALSQNLPERIWGLDIRVTTGMTENTALVGAFRPHAQVFQRQGITITISTEHASFFIENKVAILAEERLALAVYRPTAFCTVTGI